MGVREDLIAAREFIDTPDKWQSLKSTTGSAIAAALYGVAGADEHAVSLMFQSINEAWEPGAAASHDGTISAFDRAIAKAGASHV